MDLRSIPTARAVLRPLDIEAMRSILRGGEGAAPGCGDYPPSGSLIGLRIRVEKLTRGEPAGPWFQVVRRSDSRAIGDFNFHDPPDEAGVVVAGIDLAPSVQGRGLGTEIMRAACAWALAQPGIRSVRAEIAIGNAASRRMAEKAGMRFAGVRGNDRHYVVP
jgi:RimJ/RimL family protein N-acetyltransferase